MATILQLPEFRRVRRSFQLTLTQAAGALGVTPSVLDSWERGVTAPIEVSEAAEAYETYVENTESLRTAGKNMLFGCFPMRVAREILQLDLKQISHEFGYSASYWSKIEANARVAPHEVIRELEARIKDTMADLCGFG